MSGKQREICKVCGKEINFVTESTVTGDDGVVHLQCFGEKPILEREREVARKEKIDAALNMDWQQVILNGGPPCFHLEGPRYCGRAMRWPGHPLDHEYISLATLLARVDVAALGGKG